MVLSLFLIIFPLLLYITVLVIPVPPEVGLAFRYEPAVVIFFTFIITYITYKIRSTYSWLICFSTSLLLFGFALTSLWSTSQNSPFLISSLIPATDAAVYFNLGHFIHNGIPITLGFHRPFTPGFLSVIFLLTHDNLFITTATLVFTVALSAFLLSWAIRETHGPLSAACVLTGLFIYYRTYLGTLMTESLGLALGCLGLTLLWQGTAQKKENFVLIGFSIMVFALLARTGAVFVLPILLIWGALLFAKAPNRLSTRFIGIGATVLLAGFFTNSWISKYISSGNYVSFGNYSYVLYGLLRGGRWTLIHQDHPEIIYNSELSIAEKVRQVYQICFDIIREDPLSLPQGILRAWQHLFQTGIFFLFTDSPQNIIPGSIFDLLIRYILLPILLIGLLVCLVWWRRPLHSLMLCFVVGTVASAALAPTWDAGHRVYAATIATGYILLALGLWFIAQVLAYLLQQYKSSGRRSGIFTAQTLTELGEKLVCLEPSHPNVGQFYPWRFPYPLAAYLGIGLILLSSLIPVAVRVANPIQSVQPSACGANEFATALFYHPSSTLNLIDDSASASRVPNIRVSDFRESIERSRVLNEDVSSFFQSLEAENSILLNTGAQLSVIPTSSLPDKSGFFTGCFQNRSVFWEGRPGQASIFQLTSIKPLSRADKKSAAQ